MPSVDVISPDGKRSFTATSLQLFNLLLAENWTPKTGTVAGARTAFTGKAETVIDARSYGVTADGNTNDRLALQAALDAVPTTGAVVRLPPGTIRVTGPLYPKSDTTIAGAGADLTALTATTPMQAVFQNNPAAPLRDVTITDLTALGTATDDVTAPRRSRTYTPNSGIQSLCNFQGDLVPGSTAQPVTNIRVLRCKIIGTSQLPAVLAGVRGEARVADCHIENCLDTGFIFCESAIFTDNVVRKSADNGVSVSRGCKRVTVVGNNIDGSCYYGIWVAGFIFATGDARNWAGPQDFTVTGNTVTDSGKGGICLDNAPKYGAVVGNTVDGVRRGPTDGPNDLDGWGAIIGGFPNDGQAASLAAPTDLAEFITVTGNLFRNCARGGITTRGTRGIDIRANTFVDFGTQYLADGATAVAASDQSQNVGVWQSDYPATNTALTVRENTFIDSRAACRANWAVVAAATVAVNHGVNRVWSAQFGDNNLRNGYTDGPQTYYGAQLYNAIIQPIQGARAGANTATGNVPGFDMNGAAGSRRRTRWQTAAVDRWELAANGTAEAGANAGSDFELVSKTDAGANLATVLTVARSTGIATWGSQVRATDGVKTKHLSGAGKVTVTDADFTSTPQDGMVAVVTNTTDSTIRIAVRGNGGAWKISAALA